MPFPGAPGGLPMGALVTRAESLTGAQFLRVFVMNQREQKLKKTQPPPGGAVLIHGEAVSNYRKSLLDSCYRVAPQTGREGRPKLVVPEPTYSLGLPNSSFIRERPKLVAPAPQTGRGQMLPSQGFIHDYFGALGDRRGAQAVRVPVSGPRAAGRAPAGGC